MATSLADFIAFIRSQRIRATKIDSNGNVSNIVMTITSGDLPDNDTEISYSYQAALDTASLVIARFSPTEYNRAVYNLALDTLIKASSAIIFDDLKAYYGIGILRTGWIGSASDSGSSASYTSFVSYVTELNAYEMDLQKTPYGRAYFALASRFASLKNWV
jgi:hypothetical protein